jgi:vancomycin resistance protein YoaR
MSLDSLYDEVDWQEPPPPRRGRWSVAIGAVLLGLLVAYVVAAVLVGDRVPRGTTVAGIALGGQDADQARATLTDRLGRTSGATVVLASSAGKVTASPADLGVAVDVDATVDDLVGFSLAPADLWHHLVGGSAQAPVVTLDDARFAAVVEKSRRTLDAKPVEGSISVAGGRVSVKEPVAGTRTDVDGTADAVRRWWPVDRTVEVAAQAVPPRVSSDELNRVRAQFADVAVSGPVTVKAGAKSFTLTPKQIAPAVLLGADDQGRITPRADDKALRSIVHDAAKAAGAEVRAKDAVVRFAGRTPKVTPHVPGLALDDASIRTEVWKAIAGTDRTATVATTTTQPEFTTAIATKTLPKEKISSFTTHFQAGQPRVHNIELAARLINGTYVPPGEQFSMNGILGERTAAKGYVEAGIIREGRAAKSYGGGISQVSTTIFNAAFFAGVQLDAWTPHYYYISRYPEGREATISWPDLHNKFTNTTDGGILVQVTTTDTSITVTFWGTKTYDVTATKSARYDVVQPRKIVDDGPDCINQTPVVGFKVDVGRVFRQGGKVVRTQKFTTNYRPEDDVTCTNPRP